VAQQLLQAVVFWPGLAWPGVVLNRAHDEWHAVCVTFVAVVVQQLSSADYCGSVHRSHTTGRSERHEAEGSPPPLMNPSVMAGSAAAQKLPLAVTEAVEKVSDAWNAGVFLPSNEQQLCVNLQQLQQQQHLRAPHSIHLQLKVSLYEKFAHSLAHSVTVGHVVVLIIA
jgi:hypothetical protein